MAAKLKKHVVTPVDFEGVAGQTFPNSPDGYELSFKIGQGAFASVWQAFCPKKEALVAVKVIDLDSLSSSLNDIAQETKVMRMSKHPNVLSSYACFVVKTDLWLVMPLMRKGSCLRIMRYLKSVGLGEGLREDWIAIVLKATLEGLKYFHSQNQVHRDIKAGNLLMDSDGTVVISDFGVAALVKSPGDRTSERRTFVGTPCWMAPEVMEQASAYDEKADIWSLGITALELAKGYAPYARLNPMAVMIQTIREDPPSLKTYDIINSSSAIGNPDGTVNVSDSQGSAEGSNSSSSKFSRYFKEIVSMCLQKNPKLRPSAATLLTRSFFTKAKDKSSLVKDLLDAVPIPDVQEIVSQPAQALAGAVPIQEIPASVQMSQQLNLEPTGNASSSFNLNDPRAKGVTDGTKRIAKILERHNTGQSFLPGATWDFEDSSFQPQNKAGQQTYRTDGSKVRMSVDTANHNSKASVPMEEDQDIDFSAHLEAAGIKTEAPSSGTGMGPPDLNQKK